MIGGKWLRGSTNGSAIVFIHGLFSDSDSAWRSATAYWPELVCSEEDLAQYGIYTFEFDTSLSSGTYSPADASDALYEYIKLDLGNVSRVIFVAHSLGGIIARHLIVSRREYIIERRMSIGILLVASPSLGAHYANLLANVGLIYNAQVDSLRFGPDNLWLADLDQQFVNLRDRNAFPLFGRELVETDPVYLPRFLFQKRQVVPLQSAIRYFGNPIKIPKTNHLTIAKPNGHDSLQHRILVDFALHGSVASITARERLTATQTEVPTPTLDGLLGIPQLTRRMLPRSRLTENIVAELLRSHVPLKRFFLLGGQGGCGKSILAALIAREPAVQAAFPDGIYWIQLGQMPDIQFRLNTLLSFIPNHPSTFPNADTTTIYLRNYFRNKHSLIILDDVWELSDVLPFKVGGDNCRTLMTGREKKLAWTLDAITFVRHCNYVPLIEQNLRVVPRQNVPVTCVIASLVRSASYGWSGPSSASFKQLRTFVLSRLSFAPS
jgi:pimeloyl-ACP methyl ester carboxylesterase